MGMVMMEIRLFTGMTVDRDRFCCDCVDKVDRCDYPDGETVQVYTSAQKLPVTFTIPVAEVVATRNRQAVASRIYEYYNPEYGGLSLIGYTAELDENNGGGGGVGDGTGMSAGTSDATRTERVGLSIGLAMIMSLFFSQAVGISLIDLGLVSNV